ncbi:regulatory helix-turn-helix protein, lysR family [Treponema bryantii]|uniref:Regulatory helix-turn-helix protein, lysR family n=1 Tax=Treponema bryantii TaxID=163 RepID=A0A1I3LSH5_9SPIR|nr:LysR family transcriptional regulator [Treponema bryantii]SFI87681.1 regulatory helix-turn-helix protein, lysR family [Treponema bryantii]
MTLQQIRYIIGVEEAGSLNKASEKLFISQPSLTSAVHDVEWERGFGITTLQKLLVVIPVFVNKILES